ncbi:MAG: hypothetical protein OXU70_06135, partial [Gammaproteobacteria bacterium]|nr:hypothetical protein [Gammaproteobacteria bacterium]
GRAPGRRESQRRTASFNSSCPNRGRERQFRNRQGSGRATLGRTPSKGCCQLLGDGFKAVIMDLGEALPRFSELAGETNAARESAYNGAAHGDGCLWPVTC